MGISKATRTCAGPGGQHRAEAPKRPARRRVWALLTLVTVTALPGCRDATAPDEGLGALDPSGELPRRLTFSTFDDRSPSWSRGGDSVYYTTPGSAPFADSRGLLLGVPASGGQAVPLLRSVQEPSAPERWLTTPEVNPMSGRLVFTEMWSISDGSVCRGASVQCTPAEASPRAPLLQEVILRVRDPGSNEPLEQDVSLRIPFEGVTVVPGFVTRFDIEFHPFHRLFNDEGAFVFRPAWAPDGERLVFSDGLRLLTWEPGTGEAVPVPGTDDGVQPAWSPDGEWVAYTRLERGTPLNASCTHFSALGPAVCTQNRTVWPVARRVIMVTRPDGSESFEVTVGEQPAWASDSDHIVYKDGDALAMIGMDGTGFRPIPNTAGGAEPAVSPDGLHLAFSRLGQDGSFDLWVTQLDQELP